MIGLLKIFVPFVLVALWLLYFKRSRREGVAATTLYLTIFGACSSNFELVYREIGQAAIVVAGLYVLAIALQTRRILKINWILLAALFFIAVSAIFNPRSGLAQAAMINMIAITFGVNFLFLRLNSVGRLQAFLRYYVQLAWVLAAFAVVERVVGGDRAEATFSNSNYLGYFLGLACIATTLAVDVKGRWWKWALISAGIVVTGSRAAFVFPVLALLAFPLGLRLPPIRTALWVAGICIPLALGVALFNPASERANAEGSDNERVLAIEAGVAMTRDHPLTGIGWGRYQEEFWSYLIRNKPWLFGAARSQLRGQREEMVSHNDFIRVFAELGVPAGLMFIFFLIWSAVLAFKYGGALKFYLLSAQAGTLVFSLTHNNLNNVLCWWVFILPLAMYWGRDARLLGGRHAD